MNASGFNPVRPSAITDISIGLAVESAPGQLTATQNNAVQKLTDLVVRVHIRALGPPKAHQEALLRPFVAFCDDLLIDLDDGISSPEAAAFRTARRWYSFWTRELAELSQQAIRGLLGELSFLEFLVRGNGSKALAAWTGPEGKDHDFQAGHEIAFEVKTSDSIPYNVECNLNQLDRVTCRGFFGPAEA